ncbi:MAG TPA: hypothetical protein DF383_04540 [Deltaproteobacteria bacterium]|nr:hypothetical protein [Deltaproteobacteria bacterium]
MALRNGCDGLRVTRFFFRFFLLLALSAYSGGALAYSRIVSLKPNITEILFDLGLGSRVVGVTRYCERPPEAKSRTVVADYVKIFPEAVLRLRPDLVIATQENSSQKEIEFLTRRGLTVFTVGSAEHSSPSLVAALRSKGLEVDSLGFATIEETLRSIEALGKLLDAEEVATATTSKMRRELAALKSQAAAWPKKRALYVVGYQPLVVAGGNNFFDEAGAYIGTVNVVRESRLKYPYYTTELLLRAAPEIIFDFSMGSEATPVAQTARRDFWQRFRSIPAVREGRIYNFDIEKMRAAPALPETLRELATIVQGK